MIPFFKELFEYSNQTNQLLIAKLLENSEKMSEKAIRLQNHIINAHQIWNSRLLNSTPFGVFEIHLLTELSRLDNDNCQTTLNILDTFDLYHTYEYKNTKGEVFTNSVRDILFHVVNHSTYHRAQIASECRESGIDPLPTDYILFKRNGLK